MCTLCSLCGCLYTTIALRILLTQGGWRWTALVYAAYKGHLETVQVLLNAGAEVDSHTRVCL